MPKPYKVTLDLRKCRHIGELQPLIHEAFGFCEWYGRNWSAFDDFLNCEYNVSFVTVIGANTLPPVFERDMVILRRILEKCKGEHKNCSYRDFDYKWE